MKTRYILFLLIIFTGSYSFSQNIIVKLYLHDSCNDSVLPLDFYQLTKNDSTIIFNSDIDSFPLSLVDTGNYILNSQYISGEVNLNIDSYGIFTDTLELTNVNEILTIHSKPSTRCWICCYTKCNGYQVGYYNNGNKRVEGLFKKGKPIEKLTFYNINGKITHIEYYNKRGKLKKREEGRR